MKRKLRDNHSTLNRSLSLPELSESFLKSQSGQSTNLGSREHIKAKSCSLVYGISNSAAPIRKQPHPFAMQALAFRAGRTPGLPEWPPPDPPPMTLLNPILGRGLVDHHSASETSPPRTWWRRNPPVRTGPPIIHMTVDPADVANFTIPIRLIERPAQIGWTRTSEEVEVDRPNDANIPVPQQASWTEVRSPTVIDSRNSPTTTPPNPNFIDRTLTPGSINNPNSADNISQQQNQVASQQPQQPDNDDQHNHHQPLRGHHIIEPLLLFTGTNEDGQTPVSIDPEEVEEESSFHILFVIVDTNPTIHDPDELAQTIIEALTDSHRTSASDT